MLIQPLELLLLHTFTIKEMQVQYFFNFSDPRNGGDIHFSFLKQYTYSHYIKHHIPLFLIFFNSLFIPPPSTPVLTSIALFLISTISSTLCLWLILLAKYT